MAGEREEVSEPRESRERGVGDGPGSRPWRRAASKCPSFTVHAGVFLYFVNFIKWPLVPLVSETKQDESKSFRPGTFSGLVIFRNQIGSKNNYKLL